MRSLLVGAVETTAAALRSMASHGVAPALVATIPPALAGRHSDYVDLAPIAAECGSAVLHVGTTGDEQFAAAMRELRPDYLFVIGWSRIVADELLRLPAHGSIGYHPALLPENRGRAVIPWTILQRKAATGSTLFWMDGGLDSGDILAQRYFAVAPDETAATLYAKHVDALTEMFAEVVPLLRAFQVRRTPQDHAGATWCARRTPEDGLIDWNASADDVWTLIRASTRPYPGAFTFQGERRVIVWDAALIGDAPFSGTPGQVQELTADGAIVTCGDRRCVLLRTVETSDGVYAPRELFKRHERLGIDLLRLFETMKNRS